MTTHIPDCGFWNPSCDRCREIKVGDLDDNHFREVMGINRQSFEKFCQEMDRSSGSRTIESDYVDADDGGPQILVLPHGLYNFWYAIMEANALMIWYRKRELTQRKLFLRHSEISTPDDFI